MSLYSRTTGPLNSPRGAPQRPTLVRRGAVLPAATRKTFKAAAEDRKAKREFLPNMSEVYKMTGCAAALAVLTPILLPMAASAGTNSHMLQSSTPWLAICLGSVAYHLSAPRTLQQAYRQTSSKAALDGGVSYAGSLAKQESTVEASEAGAASPPEEVLSASIEKVSWVPEVTFGPRVTQPDTPLVSLVEEWTGPDADEAGRGYLAKQFVPASKPQQPLAAEAMTGLQEEAAQLEPVELVVPEAADLLAPVLAAESKAPKAAAEELVPAAAPKAMEAAVETPVLAAAAKTSEAAVEKPAMAITAEAPEAAAEKPVEEASQVVSQLAAEKEASKPDMGNIVPMKMAIDEVRPTVGDLQKQHDAKMTSLKDADHFAAAVAPRGGSGAAVAVAEPAVDQATAKAQEYEAKLSNLKQTAQKKEKLENQRWEARLGVVQQIYASAQGRSQKMIAAKPNAAIVQITQPVRHLAKLSPKAMLSNIMSAFSAVWSWLKASLGRLGGGSSPTPATQS